MTPATQTPSPVADLHHEVRVIEPEEAKRLLEHARNQAPLDQRQIAIYAQDMASDTWKLNGDPIILDDAGVLLSGRLRLHACVRADRGFKTLIVRNIDPIHFDSIDALRRRRVADIMSIRREKSGRALAAALTYIWRFANGAFETQRKYPSSQALVAILEQNLDIRYSLEVARGASPRIALGLGTALHFIFSRVDPGKADAFFADLSREDPPTGTAAALLRRQLDDGYEEGGRRSVVQLAGIIIKAWEAYKSGRPMSLLRYSPGTEQFPKVTGLDKTLRFDGVKHSAPQDTTSKGIREVERPLKVRVEIITPARAREILERNDLNRAIASAVVEKYARDMRSGAWALNGQTIKIADTGRLLDGQHRCAAAVRANTSFPAIIVEGLSEAVFDTFDLGTRRSVAAILKDRGEANTAVLAAILRQVWLIENGFLSLRSTPPTVAEILSTLEKHPQVRESARQSNKTRDIGSSIIPALHFFFRLADAQKADEFLDRLGDGVMLASDSPILKLRDALLDDRANKKRRLSDLEKAALVIKAWNFHFEGRPVRVLKWQQAGERPEEFPAIAGLPSLGQPKHGG